jgi:hypothetical protein
MRIGILVWAGLGLAATLVLTAASRRLGVPRAAGWLIVVGVSMLTIEEPLLTLWLALVGPTGDRDGMNTLVTPMARAHVLGASIFATATAVFLNRAALTALPRGEPWARRVLVWAFALVALSELTTSLFVFSRGLPLPGPGGEAGAAGFGWQPVASGLLAWGAGLWLSIRTPRRRDDAV